MIENAASKTSKLIARADGVMSESDRVAASRHFIGKLATQHKGWLFLSLGQRFKGRTLNLSTGKFEEGHYRSYANMVGKLIKEVKQSKSLIDSYKKVMEEGTYEELSSFKRVNIESAILVLLFLMGTMIMADDEDDDTAATTFSKLIYMRTFGEFTSQNILGFKGMMFDQLKDPIVIRRQVEDVLGIGWALPTGDLGTVNKNVKKLLLPTNRYNKYSDLKGYYNQWLLYNNDAILGLNSKR